MDSYTFQLMFMRSSDHFLNPELWTVELSPVPTKKRADSAKDVPQIHVAVLFQKKFFIVIIVTLYSKSFANVRTKLSLKCFWNKIQTEKFELNLVCTFIRKSAVSHDFIEWHNFKTFTIGNFLLVVLFVLCLLSLLLSNWKWIKWGMRENTRKALCANFF